MRTGRGCTNLTIVALVEGSKRFGVNEVLKLHLGQSLLELRARDTPGQQRVIVRSAPCQPAKSKSHSTGYASES